MRKPHSQIGRVVSEYAVLALSNRQDYFRMCTLGIVRIIMLLTHLVFAPYLHR